MEGDQACRCQAAPYGHSPRALLQAVFREERFFLVLSVFIGIFSGLAVVCFRFAIGWCRLYLLGSGAVLSPTRLLLAPTLAGLVIAVLVIHVFPLGARKRGEPDEGGAVYLQRVHSASYGDRKVHYGGAGDRIGTLARALRIRRCRSGRAWRRRWAADAFVAGPNAADRARGRGGGTGSGFQCADLCGAVCH